MQPKPIVESSPAMRFLTSSVLLTACLIGSSLLYVTPASAYCGHPGYPECPTPVPTSTPLPTSTPVPVPQPTATPVIVIPVPPTAAPVPTALPTSVPITNSQHLDKYCHLDEFGLYGERWTTDLLKVLSQPGNMPMPKGGVCAQPQSDTPPPPVPTPVAVAAAVLPAPIAQPPSPELPVAEVVPMPEPCWTVDESGAIVYLETGEPIPCGAVVVVIQPEPEPTPTPQQPSVPVQIP